MDMVSATSPVCSRCRVIKPIGYDAVQSHELSWASELTKLWSRYLLNCWVRKKFTPIQCECTKLAFQTWTVFFNKAVNVFFNAVKACFFYFILFLAWCVHGFWFSFYSQAGSWQTATSNHVFQVCIEIQTANFANLQLFWKIANIFKII